MTEENNTLNNSVAPNLVLDAVSRLMPELDLTGMVVIKDEDIIGFGGYATLYRVKLKGENMCVKVPRGVGIAPGESEEHMKLVRRSRCLVAGHTQPWS